MKLRFRDRGDIFWIFVWPVLMIILSASIFIPLNIDKPITLDIGVINRDLNSTLPFNGTYLIEILNSTTINQTNLFNIKTYINKSLMIEDVRRGNLDTGLYIPSNFSQSLIYNQAELEIYIYPGDLQKKQIIKGLLSEFFQRLSEEISIRKIDYMIKYIPFENMSMGYNVTPGIIRDYFLGIASPLNITYLELTPETINNRAKILGWFTFGAVGIVMLYAGLWLGGVMVVEEKDEGTLRRILASPSKPSEMLIGKTLAAIVILGISGILTVAIGILSGA